MQTKTANLGYDIIGDIHGHAEKLVDLLHCLGYENSGTGYQHPDRQVIFLGDFIDRGEELRQHKALLNIVMPMVRNGHALAVMGNHEFNALAFHASHKGRPLRPYTEKNVNQHRAFLNEYNDDADAKQTVLDFFYELPLWLEIDGIRVVHACWDDEHITHLESITTNKCIAPDILVEATTAGTKTYLAIETVLKGAETELPAGITFTDKDGNPRNSVRLQWWKQGAMNLGEVALPVGIDIQAAKELPVPEDMPSYSDQEIPCFIGHYWLKGEPEPLSPKVACLDYSVARGGRLVAYRWDGEATLAADKFFYAGIKQ